MDPPSGISPLVMSVSSGIKEAGLYVVGGRHYYTPSRIVAIRYFAKCLLAALDRKIDRPTGTETCLPIALLRENEIPRGIDIGCRSIHTLNRSGL